MEVKQFDIWVADLNPRIGSESGKTRPVLIIQSNLLNRVSHPSTIICPITTKIKTGSEILRVRINQGTSHLNQTCDIMIDQIRAIDIKRLTKKIGVLPSNLVNKVKENLVIVLDLDG